MSDEFKTTMSIWTWKKYLLRPSIVRLFASLLNKKHLDLAKCKVWWPEEPPGDMQAAYTDELSQKYTKGTLLLNTPLGSEGFIMRRLF